VRSRDTHRTCVGVIDSQTSKYTLSFLCALSPGECPYLIADVVIPTTARAIVEDQWVGIEPVWGSTTPNVNRVFISLNKYDGGEDQGAEEALWGRRR